VSPPQASHPNGLWESIAVSASIMQRERENSCVVVCHGIWVLPCLVQLYRVMLY
jgi:hypothetical protein